MREFHNLSNYYPNNIIFGNYNINTRPNRDLVSQNIVDHFSGGDLIHKFNLVHTLTKLNGEFIMSSGDGEMMTNKPFVDNCYGDVLTFGLGLGMIIFPLLNDPQITSIKIVELNQDIIDYIGNIIKQYDVNNKVTLELGDANTYYLFNNTINYDYIYFDIFSKITIDTFEDMKRLTNLYQGLKKNETSVVKCWGQDIKDLISVS